MSLIKKYYVELTFFLSIILNSVLGYLTIVNAETTLTLSAIIVCLFFAINWLLLSFSIIYYAGSFIDSKGKVRSSYDNSYVPHSICILTLATLVLLGAFCYFSKDESHRMQSYGTTPVLLLMLDFTIVMIVNKIKNIANKTREVKINDERKIKRTV